MRFFLLALSFLLAVVITEKSGSDDNRKDNGSGNDSIPDVIEQLPGCSVQCLQDAVTAAGCQVTDFACQCGPKMGQIQEKATPCVMKACSASDYNKVLGFAKEICSIAENSSGGSMSSTATTSSVLSENRSSSSAISSGGSSTSITTTTSVTVITTTEISTESKTVATTTAIQTSTSSLTSESGSSTTTPAVQTSNLANSISAGGLLAGVAFVFAGMF